MTIRTTGAIVTSCGLALSSAAWAQKGTPLLNANAIRQTPVGTSATPDFAEVPIAVVELMPIAIIQNGVRYPAVPAAPDVVDYVYSNVTGGGFFRSTALPRRILDRLSLVPGPGQGAPQTLTTVRTGIQTLNPVPLPANGNVEVELELFNDFNPGALAFTPVNTNSLGMVRVVFAPPVGTGVWANNTAYIMPTPVAIPVPIALTDTDMTVDIRCYDVGGSGNTGLSSNATPTLRDGGTSIFSPPTPGYSDGLYYRDTSGDGIYHNGTPGERFFFANRFANAAVAWQADLAATGACCLPNGSCLQLTAAFCTLRQGVFGAGACGACPQPAGVVYTNAGLSTGATSNQGPAPAGSSWAELQVEGGSCANNLFGTSANSAGPFRLADDFVLTGSTTIAQLLIFPYVSPSGEHFITPPFSAASVQIWDGPPDDPLSTVVFGDTTTNRLASQTFDNVYRIGPTLNMALATPQQPVQTETLVQRLALDINTTLPAGDYWIDFGVTFAGVTSFFPPAIAPGVRTVAGWNAKQFAAGAWTNVVDNGNPVACGAGAVPLDLHFVLLGSGGGCYANCDGSTSVPALTANDFQCFINKYAGSDPYANCDGSTSTPALTANDFQCFINKYAGGCS